MKLRLTISLLIGTILPTGLILAQTAAAAPLIISRVSTSLAGTQANGVSSSIHSSISADGRYVAFQSDATNLVPGDSNGFSDVFVKDTSTGAVTRVSTDSSGNQANDNSGGASISADGRYVVFVSHATNLVPGDTNASEDVFVKDRQTNITTRVSTDSAGTEANNLSTTGTISADGRYVAFVSFANNLVTGDTNASEDVFVKDRQTGITSRVSTDSLGNQGNNSSVTSLISADGSSVAFASFASNLVSGDTNGVYDVFVKDRQTNATTRASTDSAGAQGNGASVAASISADGRFVAFESGAGNLVAGDTNGKDDVFAKDRQTNATTRVSTNSTGAQANDGSFLPAVSADGRFVAFYSSASNLVAGDTNSTDDAFVKDRQTNATTRVSTNSAGSQGNSFSSTPAISADGRYVAFWSSSSNLVPGDTNGKDDVFVTRSGPT